MMPVSAPTADITTSADTAEAAAGSDQHLRDVGGDARRPAHGVERQHVEIDGVQADVAERDHDDADGERARQRAHRVGGLAGGVGDHVPAAEGEEAGADAEQQPIERHGGELAQR